VGPIIITATRKEGRIPCACAAQTETALFFIKASAAKAEILVGLKSEFLPGDHHGRRRRRREKKGEEEWWECGKEGVLARGVFCCSLGFVVFVSPDEETLKKKKMKRNRVKTGVQTMLAERMASTKKIAATNYSCRYGERERERFKNSHHENQSPNSTLFFHFFSSFPWLPRSDSFLLPDWHRYILSVSDYFLADEHLKHLLKVVACIRRRRRRRRSWWWWWW
jgi:hypothetical protein